MSDKGVEKAEMIPNMIAFVTGLICIMPAVYSAFTEEHTKTMPKENIFEFASSRNMLGGDYDDKRGFWDKRGYGDKRSEVISEKSLQDKICEQYPSICLLGLIGPDKLSRDARTGGLILTKRGYGDKQKRGFWDKRGFGNRREINDKRVGRFYPLMLLPNSA
ncbi:Hypothetical predicted protein [Mytilus galloprovincialis]|uniref:Uncharacterized protein n=1 Tax=Mytilus galloprovincialis TaxID=29158 RepID=A0A8B6FWL6_MYTGA|nr:Hypothetical predicted protein [Mytilus galloprovincialis]